MRKTILDIPIDALTRKEALQKVRSFFREEGRFYITTPNPEIILKAQNNQIYKKTLQGADMSIPDGAGVVWAYKLLHKQKITRITGVDFMKQICKNFTNKKIFLLGASEEVNHKTKNVLEKRYSGLKVVGNYSGIAATKLDKIVCAMINNSKADILFVAYGAPKQELWISTNLPHLNTIKIAMAVGGSFDFISGHKKRAPKWMRNLGVEWFFRLIMEPSRYKRIFNATMRFPLKVYKRKLARMFWLTKKA